MKKGRIKAQKNLIDCINVVSFDMILLMCCYMSLAERETEIDFGYFSPIQPCMFFQNGILCVETFYSNFISRHNFFSFSNSLAALWIATCFFIILFYFILRCPYHCCFNYCCWFWCSFIYLFWYFFLSYVNVFVFVVRFVRYTLWLLQFMYSKFLSKVEYVWINRIFVLGLKFDFSTSPGPQIQTLF